MAISLRTSTAQQTKSIVDLARNTTLVGSGRSAENHLADDDRKESSLSRASASNTSNHAEATPPPTSSQDPASAAQAKQANILARILHPSLPKPTTALTITVGLATIITAAWALRIQLLSWRLAAWTALKDGKESCLNDRELGLGVSDFCAELLGKGEGTARPPVRARRWLRGDTGWLQGHVERVRLERIESLRSDEVLKLCAAVVATVAAGVSALWLAKRRREVHKPVASLVRSTPGPVQQQHSVNQGVGCDNRWEWLFAKDSLIKSWTQGDNKPGPNDANGDDTATYNLSQVTEMQVLDYRPEGLTTYEGWNIHGAKPAARRNNGRWDDDVFRYRWDVEEGELYHMVEKMALKKTVDEQYKSLKSETRRRQVDRLLVDKRAQERASNVDWVLVFVKNVRDKSRIRSGTDSGKVLVVVKRERKPLGKDAIKEAIVWCALRGNCQHCSTMQCRCSSCAMDALGKTSIKASICDVARTIAGEIQHMELHTKTIHFQLQDELELESRFGCHILETLTWRPTEPPLCRTLRDADLLKDPFRTRYNSRECMWDAYNDPTQYINSVFGKITDSTGSTSRNAFRTNLSNYLPELRERQDLIDRLAAACSTDQDGCEEVRFVFHIGDMEGVLVQGATWQRVREAVDRSLHEQDSRMLLYTKPQSWESALVSESEIRENALRRAVVQETYDAVAKSIFELYSQWQNELAHLAHALDQNGLRKFAISLQDVENKLHLDR